MRMLLPFSFASNTLRNANYAPTQAEKLPKTMMIQGQTNIAKNFIQ